VPRGDAGHRVADPDEDHSHHDDIPIPDPSLPNFGPA
jgi:hypothetical protein